ncbi:MAG: leucine-rich repeat domain-containing protein [Lachnospiraceae bacterium]|nr:leucine-rich repeat domain-containing protein [Lachnospiraceae bacterium]
MPVQDRFEIGDGVLRAYKADQETEICVPEGVHTIDAGVFKGMSRLTKVSLPSSLKKIGAMAFKGCRQLKSINFPEGFSEIGEYAFHKCHSLEELIFPDSMKSAGNYALLYCDGLKRVVMRGPEKLGKAVFSHNLGLEELSLRAGVDDSNFSEEVFEGCVKLRKISLSEQVFEIGNLIEAMDSHSAYPDVIRSIAKSVYHSMQIEDGVLEKFSINLKNIILPEGIRAIGKSCFFDKKGIISITFPESLREIRANAFLNCTGLTEVNFRNREVRTDGKAFRGCCNLKRVNIGDEYYLLENETPDELAGRIRDQVLGDFYISGRILVRYMGSEEQIQIPGGVEIIGERCFFGNERLRIVLCPEGLREIREEAFSGCVNLQTIALGDKLKRVEREAFAECRRLLKCNIPDTVEYLGEYAFRRCFALKPFDLMPWKAEIHPYAFYLAKQFQQPEKITRRKDESPEGTEPEEGCIPAYGFTKKEGIKSLKTGGIRRIGKYAYASCPDLEEIEIDAPECVIEERAFASCPKLKRISLKVKALGKGCFSYCRELSEVCLSGVSVLPAECFAGCCRLRSFNAETLKAVGERCFDECAGLDHFDFSGIGLIGERAFERCDSLKSVKLDDTECGYHAFADCASLEAAEITDKTVLKSGAFTGCTQLRSVVLDGVSYEFTRFADSLNGTDNPYPVKARELMASVYSCFDIRERKQLAGYLGDAVRVTIPEDMEEVGQDVFRDHVRLKEIKIPESVKSFGSHAFFMTAWLEEQRKRSDMVIVNGILLDGYMCRGRVVIPPSVKKISSWCFAGNIRITELVIPREGTGIEGLAFRNCLNLKKITFPDGAGYLLDNVSDLTERDYPETVRRIFSECINCFKLDEKGVLTESTGNITELTFPRGIKAVGDNVYRDCHLLETIALAPDTERIGSCAFENSRWLKSVTNAEAVSHIGRQAFSGCGSLEHIGLSDALCELGSRCFEHCCSLKEIRLSDKLTKIPERAFFRCKSLKKLVIPASVRLIEKEAFAFCDGLEELYVSEDTVIEERAFAYCDKLKVTTVGNGEQLPL